jgi:hydrogenase nickel incorporation protein HypA/HybF
MHEVSLIESVIALVEQERTRQAFVRVNTIRLQVGALGCADPGALRFCFDAVANGTIAEGARLEIEIIAGEGWCADCRNAVSRLRRSARQNDPRRRLAPG